VEDSLIKTDERDSRNGYQNPLHLNTFRDWLGVAFRRRRLLVLSFSGVFLASVLFAWFWAARYYESSMQILVASDRSDPAVTPQQTSAVPSNELITEDLMNSEQALLQGNDVLRQVVLNCGLSRTWGPLDFLLPRDPEKRAATKIEKATKRLSKALEVVVEKRANIIDVTYGKTGPPETPACVLNNLSKLYLQKHLQLRRPPGSFQFFAEQTEKYQQSLADAETQLSDFGRSEGVVAPDVQRTLTAQKLVDASAALFEMRQIIAQDRRRIHSLESQLAETPARSITLEHSDSASQLLQQLQFNLLTLESKLTQMLVKYEPSYPLVQEVVQEIAQTKAAIAEAEKAHIGGVTTDRDPAHELLREDLLKTRADLASHEAGGGALSETIRNLQEQTLKLDRTALKQQALLRQEKASESNYLLYLSKREDARASDTLDSRRIDNVVLAVPPSVPVLPATNPLFVVFVGFFLAAFVSVATILLAEYLDPTFRTSAEVIEILDIPVVVSVPNRAA
jgi:uncharacterized protein involved in exopolysaccharide biosynthesis